MTISSLDFPGTDVSFDTKVARKSLFLAQVEVQKTLGSFLMNASTEEELLSRFAYADEVLTDIAYRKMGSVSDSKAKLVRALHTQWKTSKYKYIHQDGDQWVITQKGTGKVLSRHPSKEKAEEAFRAMMESKYGSSDPLKKKTKIAADPSGFTPTHSVDYRDPISKNLPMGPPKGTKVKLIGDVGDGAHVYVQDESGLQHQLDNHSLRRLPSRGASKTASYPHGSELFHHLIDGEHKQPLEHLELISRRRLPAFHKRDHVKHEYEHSHEEEGI